MNLLLVTLTSILASTPVLAGNTGPAGYLEDFQYQVANLPSMDAAEALMDRESQAYWQDSICANRAEVWSYTISRQANVKIGKVFIHFTEEGQADENTQWAYHVAPYVLVNGQEVVMDSAFREFHGKPVPLAEWTEHFGKAQNCVVLDPTHNPKHLAYEQNNMPSDDVNPNTYIKGGARQYPSDEGKCYIRKTPMYYHFPKDVYGADLALTGHAEFKDFLINDFDIGDVYGSCKKDFLMNCHKHLGL